MSKRPRQKKRSFVGTIKKLKSQVDMFGQTTTFLVDNEATYTTWIGSIVSLVIILVTLAFAHTKYFVLKDRLDTNLTSQTQIGVLPPDYSIGLEDGIQVAF